MIDTIVQYSPWPGNDAKCRLQIFPSSQQTTRRMVVIVTELPDNIGMSVTNAAELIATLAVKQYDLDPETMIWIEHYPDRHPPGREGDRMFDETFDMVTFRWEGGTALTPQWKPSSRAHVEQLTGCQV
jgi:hypothetical protein